MLFTASAAARYKSCCTITVGIEEESANHVARLDIHATWLGTNRHEG